MWLQCVCQDKPARSTSVKLDVLLLVAAVSVVPEGLTILWKLMMRWDLDDEAFILCDAVVRLSSPAAMMAIASDSAHQALILSAEVQCG